MQPLLINTSDHGGAANACIRLHKSLLSKGIESKFLVLKKNYSDIQESYLFEHTLEFPSLRKRISTKFHNALNELKAEILQTKSEKQNQQLKSALSNRPHGLEMLSFPYSNYDIRESKLFKEASLVNLHWVSMFLDHPSFFKEIEKPLVWTLHDMNPFTGGEHYTEKHLGIDENGFPIERQVSDKEKYIFEKVRQNKIKYLKDVTNLHIVTPSKWLAEEAKKSEVFGRFSVTAISNGIDTSVFQPRNKSFSRELLNLPENKKILLFVSDILGTKRKGFDYIQAVLPQLPKDTILLSIGSKNKSLQKTENYIEQGSIKDELLMSVIYSAADVFIIPSLMDNLPNTILESHSCGTPVIGFPAGGVPEMIEDGKNGYLCPDISINALKETINKFLANPNTFDKEYIRRQAVEKYDMAVQADAYLDLYKKKKN